MKKRIRTNRQVSRILFSVLIALVGLGIGISCSKDTGVSSIDPTSTDDDVSSRRPVGTKPAVGGSNYADFHPQTNVNYDPFAGMTRAERKAALGGSEGAVKHLQVVARHVAQAMQNKGARELLNRVVPKEKKGDVHLSQIMIDNPLFLSLVSEGFKDAVSDKGVEANLSEIIQDTQSNGEAILKASKALVDVVLTLVTPPGKKWNADEMIPVFSAPLDDKPGSIMKGVDAKLNPISLTLKKGDPPYTFLFLNFDEDSPMIRDTSLSLEQGLTPVERLWAYWQNTFQSISLTTPAYAHVQGSGVVHYSHHSFVAPVHTITIYDDSEGWGGGDPEIYVKIKIRIILQGNHFKEDRYDLPDVNEINHLYTEYMHLRSTHGLQPEWNNTRVKEIKVMEEDFATPDDHMGKWKDVQFSPSTPLRLLHGGNSVEGNDAFLRVVWHED